MDFIKRLFGGKPANNAPAVLNTGAAAPVLPASTPNAAAIVGGKRRSRSRRSNNRHRKQTRKNSRK